MDAESEGEDHRDYVTAHQRITNKVKTIGQDFAGQNELLRPFLAEALQASQSSRAYYFGVGLAQSPSVPTELWKALRAAIIEVPSEKRNASILGGFMGELSGTNPALASSILDELLIDPEMAPHFVYLQAQAEITAEAIERLRKSISSGRVKANDFYNLASGVISSAPQNALAQLLDELCALDHGVAAASEIFHMATHCLKTDGLEIDGTLLEIGHQLLLRTDYKDASDVREYRVQQTIEECYSGPGGEQNARDLCQHLKAKIADHEVYQFQLEHAFDAIFKVQPLVALDEFLLAADADGDPIYGHTGIVRQSPLEKVDPAVLWSWADQDPYARYPLISRSLNVFATKDFDDDDGLSPLFLQALGRAPDRAEFLKMNSARMRPSGWSGSLSAILDRRGEYLSALSNHSDQNVRAWAFEQIANLQLWAERERERETEGEESFE